MKHLIERLLCAVLGHRYVVEIEFGTSRKVGCTRCHCKWGMHDDTRSFIPWDSELEAMYRVHGELP